MNMQYVKQWNKWYKKALKRYYLHKASAKWLEQRNVSFGFWVIIFTTITGTLGGTTILEKLFDGSNDTGTALNNILLVVLGFFSVVTAVFTALQKWLNYSAKSKNHNNAASGFEEILMDLDRTMVSEVSDRKALDFFNNLNTKWKKLSENSPPIPKLPSKIREKAISEFEEEFQTRKEPPKIIKCDGFIEDLSTSDGIYITNMPEESKWSYELKNAVVLISSVEISLSYTIVIKRPGAKEDEVYNCEGRGFIDNGVAFIDYKYTLANGLISFNGVMAMRILKMGDFKGFWITNIVEDGKFAFGNIHLKTAVSEI